MAEPYAQVIARLMRETADLIERGIIQDIAVNVETPIERYDDPRYGYPRMRNTGERIVTITLRGNDFQRADWSTAAQARERPALTSDRKRLK
jgi:hypothetical protein